MLKVVEVPYLVNPADIAQPELRNGIMQPRINGAMELQDGTLFAKKLVVGAQTWAHNITWTATDYNTASWSSGTVQLSSGDSYSIDAGNTGNISARSYIYFNKTATLQVTTTYSDAVGDDVILLAIVTPDSDTDGAVVITALGSPGTTIDGDTIITGKIQSIDGNTYFDLNNNELVISNPDGTTTIDPYGVVSTANFGSSNLKSSTNQNVTSGTYTDVTGVYIDVTVTRETKILILAGCDLYLFFSGGEAIGTGEVCIKVGSDSPTKSLLKRGEDNDGYSIGAHLSTHFMHTIESIDAGTTRVKLQARLVDTSGAGTPTFNVFTADLSVVLLGN